MTDVRRTFGTRAEWNAQHDTNLREYDATLSPVLADRINATYDIELYFGRHGKGLNEAQPPQNLEERMKSALSVPTATDYEQAAAVAESLRYGDVLFHEAYGYTVQDPYAKIFEDLTGQFTGNDALSYAMGDMLVGTFFDIRKKQLRPELDIRRKECTINAWSYAARLATLHAARVLHADMDAFDAHHHPLPTPRDFVEANLSDDPDRNQLATALGRNRENAARNVVKTWAVDHLEEAERRRAFLGRKSRLAVLFGDLHEEGLTSDFEEVGLEAKITVFTVDSEVQKVIDYINNL